MLGNEKVSVQQCTFLIMFFTVGTSILVIPSSLAALAKQDAWIAAILGTGIGLLIMGLYSKIGSSFPNMNLIDLNEFVFGKWIGKAISLGFAFFTLHASAQVLYYVGNFVVTQVMPETPIEVIHILFMSIIVMGVRLGLETLARTAEIFMPWVFGLYFIFLLAVLPQSEVQNIQPVMEVGIRPILHATLSYLSFSCFPIVLMLVFFPTCLNSRQHMIKSFSVGYAGGSIIMIILTSVTILVLGSDLTTRLSYPVYALAKGINVGDFLQRIEAIIAGIWFITIFFKLAFYFYASILSISQTLHLNSYRPVIYPMGVIVVAFSLVVYPNTAFMNTWDAETWLPYVLSIGFFYPFILFVLAKVKQHFYPKPNV